MFDWLFGSHKTTVVTGAPAPVSSAAPAVAVPLVLTPDGSSRVGDSIGRSADPRPQDGKKLSPQELDILERAAKRREYGPDDDKLALMALESEKSGSMNVMNRARRQRYAAYSNQSFGKLRRFLTAEERALKMAEWERLAKEGTFLERMSARLKKTFVPMKWAVQEGIHKVTHAIVSPVTGLFKSGEALARDAHLAEDVARGGKLLRAVRGLKLASRGVAVAGLGGGLFTGGLSTIAGFALDAGLGIVAGGLTFMATGNAKAALMEGIDTAAPIPVKAIADLATGKYRQAVGDAVNWTGLGAFTWVNNLVNRFEQGKFLVENKGMVADSAKGFVHGVENIVTHPKEDMKAIDWTVHHVGKAAGLVAAGGVALGAAGLGAAESAAAWHAGHNGNMAPDNSAASAHGAMKKAAKDMELAAEEAAAKLRAGVAEGKIHLPTGAAMETEIHRLASNASVQTALSRLGLKSLVDIAPPTAKTLDKSLNTGLAHIPAPSSSPEV